MKRKALLVGINDYAPAGAGGHDLHGCLNDVRDFANTLFALGIVPIATSSMHVLTDRNATRANILSQLKWLLSGARQGDVLVFYFSGLGTFRIDPSWEELDRKDEAICPHDYASAGSIADDDIRRLFTGLPPGVTLEVVFDSSFSGSGTRILAEGEPQWGETGSTPRSIDPPLEQSLYIDAAPALPFGGLLRAAETERETVLVPGMNHVLWAACRANETVSEANFGGQPRGLFTRVFCDCLRRAGPAVSRARLDALVSLEMSKITKRQHPQLEGSRTALAANPFAPA